MKRAKKFIALLVTAVIATGTCFVAYGAENHAKLSVTDKYYYSNTGQELGKYPVVAGMDALNKEIADLVWADFTKYEGNIAGKGTGNIFSVSYEVTDEGCYAKLDLIFQYANSIYHTVANSKVTTSYYINKDTSKTMTEAEYKKALEEQAAAAEAGEEKAEEAVEEDDPIVVPLEANVEKLGYSLKWNEEFGLAWIMKEGFITSVKIDVNEYTIDKKRQQLEAAPTILDGTVYVPASFFEKVLGATVKIAKNGSVTISE